MHKIILNKCSVCGSAYFISKSTKLTKFLYECVDCKLQITFLHVEPKFLLNSEEDYEVFLQYYKTLNASELNYLIYQEGQKRQRAKEKEEEEKQRILHQEKEQKIKELNIIIQERYLQAREYWRDNLRENLTKEDFNKVLTQFVLDWFQNNNLEIPDTEQAECIANVWDNVQVVARAGSGKTRTIINKTVFLIKHCKIDPSEILILAFNKEAAMEVNERLEKVLKDESPQAMTFHALAYAMVHPEENLVYDELDKLEKSSSVQSVIDSYIHNPKYADEIKKLMMNYFREDWDRIIKKGHNLNKEDMLKYRRSLPYIGLDGKYYKSMGEKRIADYLFEHDIQYYYEKNFSWNGLNYRPDFTIELRNHYIKGIVIEYFGLFGDPDYDRELFQKIDYWSSRKDYAFIDLYPKNCYSTEETQNILTPTLKKHFPNMKKLSDDEIWERIKNRSVDEFSMVCSSFISRCRKKMLIPKDVADLVVERKYQLSNLELDFLRVIWRIYESYLDYLVQNNEEDFDGLLYRAIELVKRGEVQWRRKKGSGSLRHIKYLFIDEFQDFSFLFNELVSSVMGNNNNLNLFCVGDDWQAINGFAGSDLTYFEEFPTLINKSTRLHLATNYRSYQKIVEVGNQLMEGRGKPSKPYRETEGEVFITHLDQFNPSEYERSFYQGDLITPALIRMINSVLEKGNRVALLTRRKNGIPYYNLHEKGYGNFQDKFIEAIRKEFPEDKRELIVSINTVHTFKGKEEDTIIVLDAIERSFPLLHPRNVFFEVLGSTPSKVYEEEQRLFYVALTRAKEKLIIVTETKKESPFLNNIRNGQTLHYLDINTLNPPHKKATKYSIVVSNDGRTYGTLHVKEILKNILYNYDSSTYSWRKVVNSQNFSEDKLLAEPWVQKADGVKVRVVDEFNQVVCSYSIRDGRVFKS
ncbi:UvrD-helicase domain-containing protein [Rossellomorea arthrocnemi]|uniref:UvrD-helicase domain-containing protein n=1 Tax=Rossellomorea arthrocnemi TaxID=2769542 RepID=UPI001918003A|nr:UvrD-helicase domain-containing protein [Rossellomorea arthrocnemi]